MDLPVFSLFCLGGNYIFNCYRVAEAHGFGRLISGQPSHGSGIGIVAECGAYSPVVVHLAWKQIMRGSPHVHVGIEQTVATIHHRPEVETDRE